MLLDAGADPMARGDGNRDAALWASSESHQPLASLMRDCYTCRAIDRPEIAIHAVLHQLRVALLTAFHRIVNGNNAGDCLKILTDIGANPDGWVRFHTQNG